MVPSYKTPVFFTLFCVLILFLHTMCNEDCYLVHCSGLSVRQVSHVQSYRKEFPKCCGLT